MIFRDAIVLGCDASMHHTDNIDQGHKDALLAESAKTAAEIVRKVCVRIEENLANEPVYRDDYKVQSIAESERQPMMNTAVSLVAMSMINIKFTGTCDLNNE